MFGEAHLLRAIGDDNHHPHAVEAVGQVREKIHRRDVEVKGLLLSGVIEGGPAEEAGLRGGDVIVELAGQTITNIYDYTFALDVVKIGEPTKVVYERDGEHKETTLTPRARK